MGFGMVSSEEVRVPHKDGLERCVLWLVSSTKVQMPVLIKMDGQVV